MWSFALGAESDSGSGSGSDSDSDSDSGSDSGADAVSVSGRSGGRGGVGEENWGAGGGCLVCGRRTLAAVSEVRRSWIAVGVAAVLWLGLWLIGAVVRDAPLDRLAAEGNGVYRGSWHFPRGGPYILGVQGGPQARLAVDGVSLELRPWRGQTDVRVARKVFAPGVYSVAVEAPAGSRLVWHPPGRRGPPEYVPPSSLSPEPPGRAAFDRPGAYLADALVATAMLAVALALLVFLARKPLRRADRGLVAAALTVFLVALLVRLFDLGGAGQTWDEDVNWSAGRNYVLNWLTGDFDQRSWIWNYEHPPISKYLAGLGALWTDGYGPARALSATALAAACALVVPIGRRLFSLRVGALAGGLAALSPHLIAHGKVVGHEAPAVLLWTAAVWLCLGAYDAPGEATGAGPTRGRLAGRFAAIGLVVGLAFWSRFANGLLAPLVGGILLARAPHRRRGEAVALGLVVIAGGAVALGVAAWPRLWETPFDHLVEAWARLSKPHDPEPYLGTVTNRPPWHYFWVYIVAATPLGVWLGCALAPWGRPRRARSWLVLFLWFAAPFGVMASPVRQDGVRYVLPALIPVALASAVGFDAAMTRLQRWRPRAAYAVPAALALYFAATTVAAHPHYLDYYGEHAGGTAGAFERRWFETGWWGQGIGDAMVFLNEQAAPGAVVDKRRLHPAHLAWMRHDLWAPQVRGGPFPSPDAEWLVVNQWPFSSPDDWSLVYEVTAGGAPLVRVYRRAR